MEYLYNVARGNKRSSAGLVPNVTHVKFGNWLGHINSLSRDWTARSLTASYLVKGKSSGAPNGERLNKQANRCSQILSHRTKTNVCCISRLWNGISAIRNQKA